jgi:hypothetical protein
MTDGLAANVQDTNVTNAANKSILTRKSLWKIVVDVGDTIQRVITERSMARNERIKYDKFRNHCVDMCLCGGICFEFLA